MDYIHGSAGCSLPGPEPEVCEILKKKEVERGQHGREVRRYYSLHLPNKEGLKAKGSEPQESGGKGDGSYKEENRKTRQPNRCVIANWGR